MGDEPRARVPGAHSEVPTQYHTGQTRSEATIREKKCLLALSDAGPSFPAHLWGAQVPAGVWEARLGRRELREEAGCPELAFPPRLETSSAQAVFRQLPSLDPLRRAQPILQLVL